MAFTVVTFDLENYDTHRMHDTTTNTGRLTVPFSGIYRIWTHTDWDNAVFPRLAQRFRLNGVTYIDSAETFTAASPPFTAMPLYGEYSFTKGDYVELLVAHNHASASQNLNANNLTAFGMSYLRPK